jgi:hypothetical protein
MIRSFGEGIFISEISIILSKKDFAFDLSLIFIAKIWG